MTVEKTSPILSVRLGADLKRRWEDYCGELGKVPSTAIKEAIEKQLKDWPQTGVTKDYRQAQECEGAKVEPKVRFEVLLTESEHRAIKERSRIERCSMRRWIVDACRVGLTREPQFGMKEIDALGESNYQLLAIGRNLNQIARRLNEGHRDELTVPHVESLRRLIDRHTDTVSKAIRASLERWSIE